MDKPPKAPNHGVLNRTTIIMTDKRANPWVEQTSDFCRTYEMTAKIGNEINIAPALISILPKKERYDYIEGEKKRKCEEQTKVFWFYIWLAIIE